MSGMRGRAKGLCASGAVESDVVAPGCAFVMLRGYNLSSAQHITLR